MKRKNWRVCENNLLKISCDIFQVCKVRHFASQGKLYFLTNLHKVYHHNIHPLTLKPLFLIYIFAEIMLVKDTVCGTVCLSTIAAITMNWWVDCLSQPNNYKYWDGKLAFKKKSKMGHVDSICYHLPKSLKAFLLNDDHPTFACWNSKNWPLTNGFNFPA